LRPLIEARPGLRLPGAWDGFELGVRAILGQQITVGAATDLAARLVAKFGVPYDDPARADGLTRLFPAPARLRRADIASLGMPRSRGAAVAALASAAITDPHLFDPGQDPARFSAIPGIGEWTAQYIAMRALGETDAFPATDIALVRALEEGGRRPTAKAVIARAEAWRPWRAYAVLHLWTNDARTTSPKKRRPNARHDRTIPIAHRDAPARV
jgi:3-methyladenine DNA glycosylase/8-oxoguanine DNA glycosylase